MKIKILDNFLKEEDLNKLESINLNQVKHDEIKVYHNAIDRELNILSKDVLDEEFIKKLHKNYHNKAMNLLQDLFPEKVNLYQYSEFHIIETGQNYKFPIHDDIPDKLLSGVIYLRPEKNTGTIFYENRNGDGKNEIEWKKNRAVFFARSERKSWHSYQGDGRSNRLALVYNLMTNRDKLKDVYKIEKRNYFIGMLRYKINPYVFKYFRSLF